MSHSAVDSSTRDLVVLSPHRAVVFLNIFRAFSVHEAIEDGEELVVGRDSRIILRAPVLWGLIQQIEPKYF